MKNEERNLRSDSISCELPRINDSSNFRFKPDIDRRFLSRPYTENTFIPADLSTFVDIYI